MSHETKVPKNLHRVGPDRADRNAVYADLEADALFAELATGTDAWLSGRSAIANVTASALLRRWLWLTGFGPCPCPACFAARCERGEAYVADIKQWGEAQVAKIRTETAEAIAKAKRGEPWRP